MDSYKELKQMCLLTDNFGRSIQFTLSNYNAIATRLDMQRSDALQKFSPKVNGKNWDMVLKSIISIAEQ